MTSYNPEMLLLVFLSSFIYVGLKAFQMANQAARQYWWILPTSICMATVEVYCVSTMSKQGLGWIVLVIGVGSGLGSICATWLHHRIVNNKCEVKCEPVSNSSRTY